MNYSTIRYFDTTDGIGIRTAIYVSGCTLHCKGCHNSEAWSFKSGQPFTSEVLDKIIQSLEPEYIDGLSILGGEPTETENTPEVCKIVSAVKALLPRKSIWIYSGRTYEELQERAKDDSNLKAILEKADVLVDGPFIESQRNITLKFRGSPNQRIIDLHEGKALDPDKL
jgi:anaerobic ribonucleoside-triphosphate reductase activating protein